MKTPQQTSCAPHTYANPMLASACPQLSMCCAVCCRPRHAQLSSAATGATHQCRVLAEGAICASDRLSCLLSPSTTPRPPAAQGAQEQRVVAVKSAADSTSAGPSKKCQPPTATRPPAAHPATHRRAGRSDRRLPGSRGCSEAHATCNREVRAVVGHAMTARCQQGSRAAVQPTGQPAGRRD
jgi:hypothetical protein